MAKVSIIIPSRNEIYLQKTIDELLSKASGDIEVIVILDGYWPKPPLKDDKRLVIVHRPPQGMRKSINDGVDIARGKYLMKIDAHCMFAPNYDEILKADCDRDWLVVPRRYSLETVTAEWDIRWHRPFVDYEYLTYPWSKRVKKFAMAGRPWDSRIYERVTKLIDENMTMQGSCWFMHREFFKRRIGELSEVGYGSFGAEAQEIGMKVWLGGGKIITNKKCWYAHLWKGKQYRDRYRELYGKRYSRIGRNEYKHCNRFSAYYWMNNKWEGRIHDFEWLIDRFSPVPTWPKDKSEWTQNGTLLKNINWT